MGLHDRPYWRDDQGGGGGHGGYGSGGFTVGMPKPPKVVKTLLLLNIGIFLLQLILQAFTRQAVLSLWFGATVGGWWQIWRYVTFQFLHGGPLHVGLNMLVLYFLGTPLEKHWGPDRFLKFYLSCGAVAGLAYVIMGALLDLPPGHPIIGASGGVYAVLIAAAVLFPHIRLILFLFPVPIRFAALLFLAFMLINVLQGLSGGTTPSFWSDVAHLGGIAGGAVWLFAVPRAEQSVRETKQRINHGAWKRKMQQKQQEEQEIDRILEKIKTEGINALSRKEKKMLSDATRRQRDDERNFRG